MGIRAGRAPRCMAAAAKGPADYPLSCPCEACHKSGLARSQNSTRTARAPGTVAAPSVGSLLARGGRIGSLRKPEARGCAENRSASYAESSTTAVGAPKPQRARGTVPKATTPSFWGLRAASQGRACVTRAAKTLRVEVRKKATERPWPSPA